MQTDMHFYGTYTMARAAGIPVCDSKTIAYSAQFVDDSTQQDSKSHKDGGLLYGIATAHHPIGAAVNSMMNHEEQRRVWVPFHFIPGGEGESMEEKLICVKNSKIANEMMKHHLQLAMDRTAYGLELLGIGAHVYMDTFSHYGFSGISSKYNAVKGGSIKFIGVQDANVKKYIKKKKYEFFLKFFRETISFFGEEFSRALGHGGVATYPDRPFLHWQVKFEEEFSGNNAREDRNNPDTFLEGCEGLHRYFSEFSKQNYPDNGHKLFGDIKETVSGIIKYEGKKDARIDKWLDAIKEGHLFKPEENEHDMSYKASEWEDEKKNFDKLESSARALRTHVYRFHQAAALHRYYVLKDLLPANGIAVY